MNTAEQIVTLSCHPSTPCDVIRRFEVNVRRLSADTLSLLYQIEGELNRVRIPPRVAALRTDGLWRHTCLEAFIGKIGAPAYCEFNFAPSLQWAAYRFIGYREGMAPVEDQWTPQTTVRSTEHELELDAVIRLGCVNQLDRKARLRLATSAVIEYEDGRLSYWAVKHPPGKPDFHHPDSFALEI